MELYSVIFKRRKSITRSGIKRSYVAVHPEKENDGMGGCESKKAFKAAMKKSKFEFAKKGQRTGGSKKDVSTAGSCVSQPNFIENETKVKNSAKKLSDASKTKFAKQKSLKNTFKEDCRKKSGRHSPYSTSLSSPALSKIKLHKTSSVSPAPEHIKKIDSKLGFKATLNVPSGYSSDSINSLLSEALSYTSNANINHIPETDQNANDYSSSSVVTICDNGSISNVSSGVTSAVNSCLTAYTKQLPVLQTATVKPVKNSSGKIPVLKGTNLLSKTSLYDYRRQRECISHTESERSITTADSGVDLSIELEKVKLQSDYDNNDKCGKINLNSITNQNIDYISNKGSFYLNKNLYGSELFHSSDSCSSKDSLNEKSEQMVTYGMARQKFAPYGRNRFGFAYSRFSFSNITKSPRDSLKSSFTRTPSRYSFVKSQVALIETNNIHSSNSFPKQSTRKLLIKPTSLDKSPFLVTPAIEKTVQLSRPMCRRLDYTEMKTGESAEGDNSGRGGLYSNLSVAQDILVVDSVETERSNSGCDASRSPNNFNKAGKGSEFSALNLKSKSSPRKHKCIRKDSNLSDEQKLLMTKTGSSKKERSKGNNKNEIKANKFFYDRPNKSGSQETINRVNIKQNNGSVEEKPSCKSSASLYISCDIENPVIKLQRDSSLSSVGHVSLDTSMESSKSVSAMYFDSGERSSFMGTPSFGSTRGDTDQEFLIDDEICDQPELMFGASGNYFTDDGIFEEEEENTFPISTSFQACYEKTAEDEVTATDAFSRPRTESTGDVSSLDAEDLMLDFDISNSILNGREEEVLAPAAASQPNSGEWSTASDAATEQPNSTSSSKLETDPAWEIQSRYVSKDSNSRSVTPSSVSHISRIPRSSSKSILKPHEETNVYQEVADINVLLLKLKKVLESSEVINPFDVSHKNSLYLTLATADVIENEVNSSDAVQENADLKRQVVLLQQQLEEKDRKIQILQQQLSVSLQNGYTISRHVSSLKESKTNELPVKDIANAATQTDRFQLGSSPLSKTKYVDDGLGPTVSSESEIEHWENCLRNGQFTTNQQLISAASSS